MTASAEHRGLRLGVYCDFPYRINDGTLTAAFPFARFVEGVAEHCEHLVMIGRLEPSGEPFDYPVRASSFVALPHYPSAAQLGAVLRAVPRSLVRFWRALDGLDVVWILGPTPPQSLLFALLGRLRGRRVVLGVRQNLPVLIRHRRPDAPVVIAAAYVLEAAFRLMGRRYPVVVVGADLARHYRRSRALLTTYVSLVRERDVLDPADDKRRYDGDELVMLSVGRLDPEKNPRLLADVLARAVAADARWRLEVCGDGSEADALARRAAELGVADRVRLRGHVPVDGGLWDFYRSAHALLHVSLTEGVPQVILEAFAARLPVVGTDVGGVGGLVSGNGLLVAPGDADAAAGALVRLARERALREGLVSSAQRLARAHTLAAESARVAEFLRAG